MVFKEGGDACNCNVPSGVYDPPAFDGLLTVYDRFMLNHDTLTIDQFQKHIADRYESTDRARGTAATWMWFIEEVGELSHALADGKDRYNIEEEFADVLAWLCTLANINDVKLSQVVSQKYLGNRPPQGHK